MHRRATTLVALILLLVACLPLDAQRRRMRWTEPIPSWGIDLHYRYSIIEDDAVTLAGGRVGRQLDSSLNVGVSGSMMLTASAETRSAVGFERVTSLLYLGPSVELRDSVRGPLRFLVRASVVAGIAGYERERQAVATDGTTLLAGIEPEIGAQLRVSRAIQMTVTAGVLYAWRLDDGSRLVSGPIATLGLRLLR